MQRKQRKQWGYSSGKNFLCRDFPTSPVVKIPYFHRWRYEFHPQSEELRSHMPQGMTKKKKRISFARAWRHGGKKGPETHRNRGRTLVRAEADGYKGG